MLKRKDLEAKERVILYLSESRETEEEDLSGKTASISYVTEHGLMSTKNEFGLNELTDPFGLMHKVHHRGLLSATETSGLLKLVESGMDMIKVYGRFIGVPIWHAVTGALFGAMEVVGGVVVMVITVGVATQVAVHL